MRLSTVAMACAVLTATLSAHGTAEPAEPALAASDLVIGFHDWDATVREGTPLYGAHVVRTIPSLRAAIVTTTDPPGLAERAREDANVRYIEADPLRPLLHGEPVAAFTPDDPRYSSQYGPAQVDAPRAWDATLGSTQAAVCILDTGIRASHEDLRGDRYMGGYDVVNRDNDPADDAWHGTHVTAIAAAGIDNGVGIAGMANAAIYSVKVLDAHGSGTWSGVAEGITWCADNTPVRTVLSMSLGARSGSSIVRDAVAHAYTTRGKLLVASSGNDGPCSNCVSYPAAYPEVIAVGCTASGETLCGYSSTGPEVELSAPGDKILSAYTSSDTAYATASGTSMSAPHVSGVAALLWAHSPGLTAPEVRRILQETAQDLGPSGRDPSFGHGELHAAAAVGQGGLPPSEPQSLSVTVPGVGSLRVHWRAPTDTGGLPLTAFRVYGATEADPLSLLAELPANATTYDDLGLAQGEMRRYRVSAVNEIGEGPLSVEVTGKAASPPSAPRQLSSGQTPLGTRLRWYAPETSGGLPLTGYVVYRGYGPDSGEPLATVDAVTQSYKDSTCPLQLECHYWVTATNPLGESEGSNRVVNTGYAFQPNVARNADGSFVVYNDANGNGQVDERERYAETPVLP